MSVLLRRIDGGNSGGGRTETKANPNPQQENE